jgi:hypothetical protein
MPTQKDLKRLVRARMRKTGEAYTTARAQIISKPRVQIARDDKPDYAKLAGMSDAKIKEHTACTWEKWVYALDRRKAYELTHSELAKLIKEKYKTPDWWTQTVAVGYERIKGLRAKGQRRDGSYSANKSRTFNVPLETLFEAWTDAKTRTKMARRQERKDPQGNGQQVDPPSAGRYDRRRDVHEARRGQERRRDRRRQASVEGSRRSGQAVLVGPLRRPAGGADRLTAPDQLHELIARSRIGTERSANRAGDGR